MGVRLVAMRSRTLAPVDLPFWLPAVRHPGGRILPIRASSRREGGPSLAAAEGAQGRGFRGALSSSLIAPPLTSHASLDPPTIHPALDLPPHRRQTAQSTLPRSRVRHLPSGECPWAPSLPHHTPSRNGPLPRLTTFSLHLPSAISPDVFEHRMNAGHPTVTIDLVRIPLSCSRVGGSRARD